MNLETHYQPGERYLFANSSNNIFQVSKRESPSGPRQMKMQSIQTNHLISTSSVMNNTENQHDSIELKRI